MAVAYYPSIVTNGLIFCVDAANPRSYPRSGTNWNQVINVSNTGVLTNGPSFNTANSALSFDGTDDYVDFSASLGTLSNYTLMFWARRDVESRMPVAARTGTAFYWYGDNSYFYTHGGVTGEYYYAKPTSIPLGTWGHYCVVYNGSNVSIYRQGVFQGSQNTTGTANWSQGIRVGGWAGGAGYAWQGLISNVMMYSTALTAADVKQNFNALRGRYNL